MESSRPLKNDLSQQHLTPVDDDRGDGFEEEDVEDDLMALREKSGESGE